MSATLIDVRKITYSEFRQMAFNDNDTFLYELTNGTPIKKTAYQPIYQRILAKLLTFFNQFIEKKYAWRDFSRTN